MVAGVSGATAAGGTPSASSRASISRDQFLKILVSELTYATGGGEEKAEAMIDKVLDESHGARVMAEA